MPAEMEAEKKKAVQQQQQNLALVTPKPSALTPAEQTELQKMRQQNKEIEAYNKEASATQQAKKAGETAFYSEFKRGLETVGLFIQKGNPSVSLPQVTEQTAKDLVSGAQQDVIAFDHGINEVARSRRMEITGQAGEKARLMRTEYEAKLNGILGPEYSSQIYDLNGTAINENVAKTPEVKAQLADLNRWRAGEMAAVVSWREGEMKKVEDWKTTQLAKSKADVELNCLTRRVLDLYSLQGENRTQLAPAIQDVIRETRATANQAFTAERDNTYNQLKKESTAKGEG